MSLAFSSDGAVGIQRALHVENSRPTRGDELETHYELQRCVDWIGIHNLQRVALQFPDELLADAVAITTCLQKRISGEVFILGDTSYGSCCVDEVAAQHYSADGIIHFGRACLSPVKRLPVIFVFGHQQMEVEDCIDKFKKVFPDTLQKVIILYDVVYSHHIDNFHRSLADYKNVIRTWLNIPTSMAICDSQQTEVHKEKTDSLQTISKCGRTFHVQAHEIVEEYRIFYIGNNSLTLTNFMYTFNKGTFFTYDPMLKTICQESLMNRRLMKRYYMIERAKDARIVGIVVGTLGVRDYLASIDRLKDFMKKAGKKVYTFVIGKLNVPKLANFMEIDVFVLVACPENTLIDSAEFYKPVVTPFEMEMACNSARTWTGDYVTDFRMLLPGAPAHVELSDAANVAPDVSLITGKLRDLGRTDQSAEPCSAVMPRSVTLAVSTLSAESASEFLKARSWQGLERQLGTTPLSQAIDGTAGLAMQYEHEAGQTTTTTSADLKTN